MRVFRTGYGGEVRSLAFSPDGTRLATCGRGGGTVHDLCGARPDARLPGAYRSLAFDSAGTPAAVVFEGRARFDPETGANLGTGPADADGPGAVQAFAGSACGTRLVTAQADGVRTRLAGWEAAGGGWERRWGADVGWSSEPALSVGADRVAVVAVPRPGQWTGYQLQVRDLTTGEVTETGSYPFRLLGSLQYRPDDRQLVAAHDFNLVLWDVPRYGKPTLVPNASRQHFTAAAYHPSGRYLFTTSNDATVTVWDTDSWVRVKRFAWDVGRLRSVAVSADGLLAAAGSDRGRVVVWDVDV